MSKPKRSNRDRPSSHEKKIKAEKAVLRKEHKLWKSGKSTMSEEEVLSKSRRFHMLLKKHSKMQKMRNLKKHLREAANQLKRFRNDPWKFGTEVFRHTIG